MGRAFLVGARPMGGAIPVGHGHGKEEGPLSWACFLGLSRQFRYALSLSVFDYNYTRRVYNRAGPWTFGFGIQLSLLSLCLLVTLGRLRPSKKENSQEEASSALNRKRSETYSYCTRLPGVGNQYRQLDPPIRITAQIFVPQIRAQMLLL